MSSDSTRASRHKLKHMNFHLIILENFFAVGVINHWYRLPREAVGSPSLEIFKSHLRMDLDSCLFVTLLEEVDWTR